VEYAALAEGVNLPEPRVIFSVEPALLGEGDPTVNLGAIDPRTRIVIAVGDRDDAVADEGARQLLKRLQAGHYPPDQISIRRMRSHGAFVADHMAPTRSGPAERAAIWAAADRLIAQARRNATAG